MVSLGEVYQRKLRAIAADYGRLQELSREHELLTLARPNRGDLLILGPEFEKRYSREVHETNPESTRLRTHIATLSNYETALKQAIIGIVKARS